MTRGVNSKKDPGGEARLEGGKTPTTKAALMAPHKDVEYNEIYFTN
jgi:hypothetical protein